jgi:hypothetical protein
MRAILLFFILGVAGCVAFLSRSDEPIAAPPPRFRIWKDGKWGFIDRHGKVAIQPQYDHAYDFADGVAVVTVGSARYFIEPDGKVTGRCPFHDEVSFSEGYAGGHTKMGFRFVDRYGEYLDGTFVNGGPFREGLAAVAVNTSPPDRFKADPGKSGRDPNAIRYGFINKKGRLVIRPEFLAVGAFSEGLAAVYVGGVTRKCTGLAGGKWGFINKAGKIVISPQFEGVGDFSEGLAAVRTGIKTAGYIDRRGRYVIPPGPYFIAGPFKEGLAYVRSPDEHRGVYGDFYYLDRQGRTLLPMDPRYSAHDFAEGFVEAQSNPRGGKRGFVDRNGKWLTPPVFDHVTSFRSGLACVYYEGKMGYIDRTGRFAWEPTK